MARPIKCGINSINLKDHRFEIEPQSGWVSYCCECLVESLLKSLLPIHFTIEALNYIGKGSTQSPIDLESENQVIIEPKESSS